MARFEITTTVEYVYEVEADDYDAAEKEGWNYEDYPFAASVYSIEIAELKEIEEDEDEED